MTDISSVMAGIVAKGMSPEDIYRQITTGPGAQSVDEAQTVTGDQAALHQQIVDLVRAQQDDVGTGWQSASGDAAANAATPVSQVADQAAQELRRSADALVTHTSTYQHVRNNVVEMPENPGEPDFVAAPFPMAADHAAKTAAYEAAAERNVAVYEQYATASGEIGAALPADYGSLQANAAQTEITVTPGRGE